MSFEDATRWASSQAGLSGSTERKTHLQRSLRAVKLTGWALISGVPFSSAELSAPLAKCRIEFWVPAAQPNPTWHGQFELRVDVPSAGIQDASCGLIELTPLAKDRFNTLEFQLPGDVRKAIDGTHSDVRLKLVLDVPARPGPYHADNVRFV